MHRVLVALSPAGAMAIPSVVAAQSQSPCVTPPDMASALATADPSICPDAIAGSRAPIRPGEIIFGASVDAQTGEVTDPGGPFVAGTPVAFVAWLDPALTFPTVHFIGTLDAVPWFDIPTPVDTGVNGTTALNQGGRRAPRAGRGVAGDAPAADL